MTEKKTKLEIRWPSAAVLIVGIVAVTCVYVFVPEHRTEIALGVGGAFTVVLAFMRRILGLAPAVALLAISATTSGCGPGTGPAVLTALELARKIGCDVICDECAPDAGPSE